MCQKKDWKQHKKECAELADRYLQERVLYLQERYRDFDFTTKKKEKKLGSVVDAHPTHDGVGRIKTCISLAQNMTSRGDFEGALKRYVQAFEIWYGAEHTTCYDDMADDIFWGMGITMVNLGQYEQAKLAFQDVVKFRREAFGLQDPSLAQVMYYLGECNFGAGHMQEAMHMYLAAVDILAEATETTAMWLAQCWVGMANVLVQFELFDEAILMYSRASGVYKEVCDDNHPHWATLYKGLAGALVCINKDKEALALLQEARKILLKIHNHDKNHIVLAPIEYEVATIMLKRTVMLTEGTEKAGVISEILGMYRHVLEVYASTWGKQGVHTKNIRNAMLKDLHKFGVPEDDESTAFLAAPM